MLCIFPSSDLPSATVNVSSNSITLNWDGPPPELTGDPQRAITQYAVTLTPQNGGEPITTFSPAEAGSEATFTGLEPETTYDIQINAVIDTEGQGEETFDIGVPLFSETTCECYKTLRKFCYTSSTTYIDGSCADFINRCVFIISNACFPSFSYVRYEPVYTRTV